MKYKNKVKEGDILSFNLSDYTKSFTDMMSEGFIVIDTLGKIQVYNKKAQDIFKINQELNIKHREGKLKKGDIVIIANNSVGDDDGNLNYKDLYKIGIKNSKLRAGDAIIGIGVYDNDEIKPIYKILDKDQSKSKISLKTKYLGLDIEIVINFIYKNIQIFVEEKLFSLNYHKSVGHMVVVDGDNKEVKFYQHHGYTARGESLKDLLDGKEYRAKGYRDNYFNVLGKNIFDINKSDSIIEKFYLIAKGENIEIKNEFEDINGISTLCTVKPVKKDAKVVGAALKVEDISLIKSAYIERDQAIKKLKKAEEKLMDEKILKEAFPDFVGESKVISNIKKMALKVSKSKSNILILGESGTGKTILAKYIHENSNLKDKPFVQINCGAIPKDLLESELFGYEPGAFTGAHSLGKKGILEMGNGGTVLLDEIGDLPIELQVKLLDVIQNKSFYRVGGTEKINIDIRIISATNKNLEKEIIEERFREDLYYRINVFPIQIPALKDRKEDIFSLVDYILPKICKDMYIKEKILSTEAMNILYSYNWPGNIRELENVLERAIMLSEGPIILSKNIIIDGLIREEKSDNYTLKEALALEEKKIIENVLKKNKGDKKKSMKDLDISKSSFYKKLNDYNIM